MCSTECSLATPIVEERAPVACYVVTLVAGRGRFCFVGGFGTNSLSATPLRRFTLAWVCGHSRASRGGGLTSDDAPAIIDDILPYTCMNNLVFDFELYVKEVFLNVASNHGERLWLERT